MTQQQQTETSAAAQLRLITEALRQPLPDLAPADIIHGEASRDAVAEYLAGVERPRPWTIATPVLARHIHNRLQQHAGQGAAAVASPLQQAEEAKRRRSIVGEVKALVVGDLQRTTADWYPARPGDLVHIHFEAFNDTAAFGETYAVKASDASPGGMGLVLLHHTAEDADMVGLYAGEGMKDPLETPWMEAGPYRLTIVRDGRVVHAGGEVR